MELPVEWIGDDARHFMMNRLGAQRPYTPPADVLDISGRELYGAHAEGGLFLLAMHRHVSDDRSRIVIPDGLLHHITAKGERWIATYAEVAR